jgi:hypothetical protein
LSGDLYDYAGRQFDDDPFCSFVIECSDRAGFLAICRGGARGGVFELLL